MRFLRARLTSGQVVVSQYEKLENVEKYVNQVFLGQKPFNVWLPTGDRHPQSGEKVSFRKRKMYPGRVIDEIEEVQPVAGRETTHNFEPSNFEAVITMGRGARGIFTVPSETERGPGLYGAEGNLLYTEQMRSLGLQPGTRYPVHRDQGTFRDYIVVRAGENGAEDLRYYLDGHGAPQPVTVQGGDDDDWGDDDSSEGGYDADEDDY